MKRPFRWWIMKASSPVTMIGLIGIFYSVAPLAQPLQAASTQNWGTRDFITLLIGLLVTVLGAYFSGARREMERLINANQAHATKLEARLDAAQNETDDVHRLLLRDYLNKADLTDRFIRLEGTITNQLSMLNHRLDQLNVPPASGPRP